MTGAARAIRLRGMVDGWPGAAAAIAALVFVGACSNHDAETELARRIIAIVDTQFQECVFGAEIPPGTLGRTEVIAEVTGAVDAHRVYSCAELTKTRYEAIPGYDQRALAPLIARIPIEDDPHLHEGFGVCAHLARIRVAARQFDIHAPTPDCASNRDQLTGIVDRDETGESHVYRDRLALVDGRAALRLHRTQDGTAWDVTPPTLTSRIYVTGATDAFAYSYRNEQTHARNYVALDGDTWHVGTAVVGWRVVSFRRTTSGWCIVTIDEATETPQILQLDPLMDHVLARTSVPALRGRWSEHALRAALIDHEGNVSVLVAIVGSASSSLESHFVSATGQLSKPTTIELAHVSTAADIYTCRAPGADYVVLARIGSLVTTDLGRTFTQLENGIADAPVAYDCTDAHLFVATKQRFESCDHHRCSLTPMPVPKGRRSSIALNVSGEQPRIFASYDDVAFMATPSGKDGLLEVSHVWRIKATGVAPVVRIDGLWFSPRLLGD